MKSAKLVPTIKMVLSLTFVVTVQPLQGQAQPGQPVISLDFAQYCIGDSWKLKLSNGVPNTSTRLSGSSNGQSWEITDWRKTDAAGSLSEGGTFPAEAVGSHTLKLDIGGNMSTNTISFNVFDCRLKGSRIAFVSTRDGGGGASGPRRSIVLNQFTAPGDQQTPFGSRMRIFVLEDGSVRQLIPDAVAPVLPDYWDSQPAWSRVRQ